MTEDLPIFSVSEFSFEFKKIVETAFGRVKIKGEIFGAKRADSGHLYLSLKDENATISAVCWKGVVNNLSIKPQDGMEVVVTGKITTFPSKSSYQIVIESMEVAGVGALLKLLEERKQAFAQEGLFDVAHKQKIPYLPKKIGVVSSASGAVIRDIIHRISERFPLPILLVPTPVQGIGAELKIAQAIKLLNSIDDKPDVIIVARGGGSLEDLWCFNEEVVIRAVFASKIPIISAVGHETDTMLIDYVADLRAPTPTGAAEMAVPVRAELLVSILNLQSRMISGINRFFAENKNKIEGLGRGIPNLRQVLNEISQKLDDRIERLNLAFKNLFSKNKENLHNLDLRLESVSFASVLKRGFAIVKTNKNKLVSNLEEAKKLDILEINFIDGTIKTRIINEKNNKQPDLFDI